MDWRAQHDSNVRPPPSEGGTLSTELWALGEEFLVGVLFFAGNEQNAANFMDQASVSLK